MTKPQPETTIRGIMGDLTGIPVFEDKFLREGTYVCLDKDGLPIKQKDLDKTPVAKILVHDFETFKMSMKYNQESKKL